MQVESRPNSVPPNGGMPVPIPTKMNGVGGSVDNLAAPSSSSSAGTSSPPTQAMVPSPGQDGIAVQAPAPIQGHVPSGPSISTSALNGKQETSTEPEPESLAGSSTISSPTSNSVLTSGSIVHTTPVASTLSRKSSSFRHVPLRGSTIRSPLRSSPLRPAGTQTHRSRTTSTSSSTSTSRQFEQNTPPTQAQLRSKITSAAPHLAIGTGTSDVRQLPTIPSSSQEFMYPERGTTSAPDSRPSQLQPQPPAVASEVIIPPIRADSLMTGPRPPPKHQSRSPSQSQLPSPAPTPRTGPSPAISPSPSLPLPSTTLAPTPNTRAPAPYRPGFQPKGVYRPLTDEFTSARKIRRDIGRIERTKLERRLEKLIQLHFSPDSDQMKKQNPKQRPAAVVENRRASSFFDLNLDFSDLKNMDAGELWRGVVQSQAVQGGKADIRGGCGFVLV
jgi:rabenosyn-5